jgi:hypothetical protein
MKRFLFILLLMALIIESRAQENYYNQATVISSGGGESLNLNYRNFGVIGELIVSNYVATSTNNGTYGFIFQDDGKIFAPPLKAVLLYPQNNAILQNDPKKPLTITFYWIQQNEVSFRFQLSRSSDFSSPIVDSIVTQNYFSTELPQTGELYWRVQSIKGQFITDWSDTWRFNLLLTDVEEDTKGLSILVYPNPASERTDIIIADNEAGGTIYLTDLMGNIRTEIQNVQEVNTLDLSSLEQGVYIISFKSIKGVTTGKLIKN